MDYLQTKTRPEYNFQEHSLHWKFLIFPGDCRRQLRELGWQEALWGLAVGSCWEEPPFVTDVPGNRSGHRP